MLLLRYTCMLRPSASSDQLWTLASVMKWAVAMGAPFQAELKIAQPVLDMANDAPH